MRMARAPRFAAVDTAVRVTPEQAGALYKSGYRTVFRYVDRVLSDPDEDTRWPINLTRPELEDLLGAGLCVGLVQYFSTRYESTANGAKFSVSYGERMGEAAALNARRLGIPDGVTIFNDLEACEYASADMVRDYCDGWSHKLTLLGYAAGLYVGSGIGGSVAGYTSGSTLYGMPRYRAYWRAASIVPQIPNRGWTVIQGCEISIHGLACDQDIIALDHRSRSSRDRFMVVSP